MFIGSIRLVTLIYAWSRLRHAAPLGNLGGCFEKRTAPWP